MTNGGRYMFLAWALIFAAGEAMAAAISPLAELCPAAARFYFVEKRMNFYIC